MFRPNEHSLRAAEARLRREIERLERELDPAPDPADRRARWARAYRLQVLKDKRARLRAIDVERRALGRDPGS